MQFVLPLIAIALLGVVEISLITDRKSESTPTPTPIKQITTPVPTEIKPSSSPTKNPTSAPQPESTPSEQITKTNSSFMYPGAKVTLNSSSEINLESSDTPQVITNWYKNYIQGNNMNTTSFVTTNTNDNVLNRLVGAGNGQKIDVEIRRNAGENISRIKIIPNSP